MAGAMEWRADSKMREFFEARGIALSPRQMFRFDGRERPVRLLDGRVVSAFGLQLPERFGNKRNRLLVDKFFFPPLELAAGEVLESFTVGDVEFVREDGAERPAAPALKLVPAAPPTQEKPAMNDTTDAPFPPLEAYVEEVASRKGNGSDGGARVEQDGEHLLAHAFWMRDARLTLDLPYVVKGLFGRRQIIVLWGAPGSGKSFNATELSACIGAGVSWHGRKTKRGIVLYVVAESSRPYISNRLLALKQERPELADARLVVVPLALDLLHTQRGDVDRVIKTAEKLDAEDGEVALIVIDTLATTFGGGNENAPEDMGLYVANLLHIRDQTGAAVLVVHHCGKDEAKGMRGHTALLGALDAELAVEGAADKDRILRTGKVRDGDGYTDLFGFRLRVVELGTDAEGDPVRTCVVEQMDEAGTQRARRQRKGAALGKHQKAVLRVIEAAGGRMVRINLAHQLKDEGMPRNRVHDALGALLDTGMLIAHNEATPPEVSLA